MLGGEIVLLRRILREVEELPGHGRALSLAPDDLPLAETITARAFMGGRDASLGRRFTTQVRQ